ncbi:Trm112 [Taphrina deformans PYCC 5710]|uniref:Multifunctional methyltransferase subunit trm112 n=1 Tax=Taphrina deformans (strain PYCC 5710 / ATCC 11124 / CBS 356.35 / IMI 108563 / JCM 9778 / NBRC 8474) TaxID=1097556 RepID=R4X6S5_TAPDE|nr:Trm112 [Taphrina deformans PYCC 5710]|eukprot:CCG80906.1 Trm112 [Taphrina deformans PYCC 5710]
MKLLTSNFLTCAVKSCRGHPDAYPLHFSDCELSQTNLEFNPTFIQNIMPRIEWPALLAVCAELGNTSLPGQAPEKMDDSEEGQAVLQSLHNVLLETSVREGKMTCGKCGHVYLVKEGIANMLLAEHEVV